MPRPTDIQNIIEEAVAEVLDAALPKLRSEIVRRAVEVVESLAPAPGASPSDLLNAATAAIHESGSQADILRHLLEFGLASIPVPAGDPAAGSAVVTSTHVFPGAWEGP